MKMVITGKDMIVQFTCIYFMLLAVISVTVKASN